MPILKNMTSVGHYFESLVTFQTLDFQPVRDLSLALDLFFLKHFEFNSYIFQNVLIWAISSVYLTKILDLLFPELDKKWIVLITTAHIVYPLFVATICWSMARKHLLAYLFLCISTFKLMNPKSRMVSVIFFYALSVLSHPIGVLWPVWALTYKWQEEKSQLRSLKKVFLILFTLMLIFIFLNYIYYETSSTFKNIYDSKTQEFFNVPDKILALGHYSSALALPYQQSFFYDLGHWSTLSGLVIIGLSLYMYRGLKLSKKFLINWGVFGVLPLFIVLSMPSLLSDTYLLFPAVSGIVFITHFLQQKVSEKYYKGLYVLVGFWSIFTFSESLYWTDSTKFTTRNFERRPNCWSAVNLAKLHFTKKEVPSSELKQFIYLNQCLRPQTLFQVAEFTVINANFIYYDANLSAEAKINELKKFSHLSPYPELMIAAILIDEKKTDLADTTLKRIFSKTKEPIEVKNDPVLKDIVRVYCSKRFNDDCLALLK